MFRLIFLPLATAIQLYQEPLKIPEKQNRYEFWLAVNRGLTLGDISNGTTEGSVFVWNDQLGVLQMRDNQDCSNFGSPPEEVVTADGRHRRFIAVNNTLPGPTLVVWEGAEVVVHVTNNLETESVTVHFHGQIQNGSFWYDGAGNINQCPIRSGETFAYRFKAEPSGTFFYHGHFMGDRADGLIGAFVVLPDTERRPQSHTQVDVGRQFVVTLQDWFPTEMMNEYMYGKWGLKKFRPDWNSKDDCYTPSRTYDGGEIGKLMWQGALINGRGWYDVEALKRDPEKYPIARFKAKLGDTTLLRIIGATAVFPLMFSVQDHNLRVIASDGNLIEPVDADYIVVMPGERYDVILQPTVQRSEYFMISQSIEIGAINANHFTLAILEYENAANSKPAMLSVAFPPSCNADRFCTIINCPFRGFETLDFVSCINFDIIRHLEDQKSDALMPSAQNIQEEFFNIYIENNIAGQIFTYPKAPPALFPYDQEMIKTTCQNCERDGSCRCTQQLNLLIGNVVQLVFYNRGLGSFVLDDLDASAHPMHIHGHHFYVVAVGYPTYNKITGQLDSFNQDLVCVGKDRGCNVVKWASEDVNKTWNLLNPPMKDTIAVPVGGYVVLRFMADNPGIWIGESKDYQSPVELAVGRMSEKMFRKSE